MVTVIFLFRLVVFGINRGVGKYRLPFERYFPAEEQKSNRNKTFPTTASVSTSALLISNHLH